MGPSVVLVTLAIVLLLVSATDIRRDQAVNTSGLNRPTLRVDNNLDEGPRHRESDDAECKIQQYPKDVPCYKGYKYQCVGKTCYRSWSTIKDKTTTFRFYDNDLAKCESDEACWRKLKNLEKRTPGAIPCVDKWSSYPCEKGYRWGCAKKSWTFAKYCWRERTSEEKEEDLADNRPWPFQKGYKWMYYVEDGGKRKLDKCSNHEQCREQVMDDWPYYGER